MNKRLSIVMLLICLSSCSLMNKKDIKESFSNVNKLPNTKILRDWIAYYKLLDTSFSINSLISIKKYIRVC